MPWKVIPKNKINKEEATMFELEPMIPITMEARPILADDLKVCGNLEDFLSDIVGEHTSYHGDVDFVKGWDSAIKYCAKFPTPRRPLAETMRSRSKSWVELSYCLLCWLLCL